VPLQGPDPVTAAGPATTTLTQRPLSLPSGGPAWWALVIVVSVATARASLFSIQLGCTVALLIITLGLYARNRSAGLVAVWLTWLLAPFVRRIFLLSEPFNAAEPLALAPFLVTGMIVALEYQQVTLSRRARRILLMVTAAYIVGLPVGFRLAPPAAMFALFAYMTAFGCFVIGYREAQDERRLVLPRLLIATAPFLALYAFRQYFVLPLPEWDEIWQAESQFNSGGAPDEGHIRVWGTLNSPGTFALVMATATFCYLTVRRLGPWSMVGIVAALGGLALTYVRSAWLGMAVTLILIVLVSRGGALKRVAPLVLVLAALGPVALGGSTQAALSNRVDSLGNLEGDQSASDRAGTTLILIPYALSQPGGAGLGQAGEPTRLGGGGVRVTDNGYLAQMLQVGPIGFMLLVIAIGTVVRSAWRNAWWHPKRSDLLVFAIVSFFLVTMLAGDQLYGLGGMVFWYAAGVAVCRRGLEGPAWA
jgi:putative inorganic carbon (hco3(-)) transporter